MSDALARRRLIAILAADAVGYSRLMARNELGTLADLDRAREVFKRRIEGHGGHIVDMAGDSILASFETATGAVSAALEIQEQLEAESAHQLMDDRMLFRIGVNLGDVFHKADGTIYGDGVNIAARLEALASPGGIAISESVRVATRGKVEAEFEDQGEQRVKNIAEPIRIFRLSKATQTQSGSRPGASTMAPLVPERPSIAVLPFTNMSGDPDQDYFSDGITEDIITELSRWRLLAVRSRSASFRYRGAAVDVDQVARELHIRYIVAGSVRRMGDRIRISVQLTDAESGRHIWSEKFDRRAEEIFEVQDRVVQTVVSTLVGRVQVSDADRARRKPPASLAAYECVMRANALAWDDPEGEAEAMRLVEKAIALDPGYGFAHALLAALIQARWRNRADNSDAELDTAYDLATRAVALDDSESTCHSILGQICVHRRSYDLGVQYARRAVEINPNNQWNAADLGFVLVYAGEPEEALSWCARAREIDPYFDQPWYWRVICSANMSLHRYEDALSALSHARSRHYRYAALLAACHARLGNTESARAKVATCLALRQDFSIAHFLDKERFKRAGDSEQLAASLRLAGFPD